MLTKARADELAANLDREERVIDKLRGRIADYLRELKYAAPDERREAAAELVALIESLDRGETEVEEARRELADARAEAGV
jgi:hypothetical protein